ncbi:helix-turn-helix transcriptional regulator [Streptomyces macrosporus]|uniref:HTH luxR-type domain-containing protein n=1 Tax=Streptomyces macrosporus TaxID=44032 RepID=A0ABN3JCP2_9ACTN
MTRPRPSDYDRMLDLAVGVLEATDPDEVWQLVVRELMRALNASVVVAKDVDWTPSSGAVAIWRGTERQAEPVDDLPLRHIRAGYPFAGHYVGTPADRSPRTAAELAGGAAWLHSEAADVNRRLFGTRHALGLPLPAPRPGSSPVRGFIVHRDGPDFRAQERRYAGRVQPLLAAAASQRGLLTSLREAPGPPDVPAPVARAAGHDVTPRELTVLLTLAEGLSATSMARRLGISVRTVHKHLQNLYRKLGTADRLETVLRAQEMGLLPGPGTRTGGAEARIPHPTSTAAASRHRDSRSGAPGGSWTGPPGNALRPGAVTLRAVVPRGSSLPPREGTGLVRHLDAGSLGTGSDAAPRRGYPAPAESEQHPVG